MSLLPVPQALPTPVALPAVDPLLGQNPYARPSTVLGSNYSYMLPAMPVSQILGARAATQQSLFQNAQFAAAKNALGLNGVLESNPNEWSAEEAAAQTDRALAKLSTINPELAEELAARRAGQAADGGGFWNDLLDLGGDILGGLGKVLEVVSRPAHIIPNLIYDIADGGEFHGGHDIMGALTGTVNHNWNEVFQELGWEGDGFLGAVRAVVGFAADVATDPVTWVFPAGAGIKAAEAAALGARSFATAADAITALGVGEKVGSKVLNTADDVAGFLRQQWDAAWSQADLREAMRRGTFDPTDAAERLAAATDIVYSRGIMDAQRAMFEVGSDAYRITAVRGLSVAARNGVRLGDGVVDARAYKNFLEEAVKRGNFSPFKSSAWQQGRAFASIAGGLRLKVAVPFTDFRYISPALTNGVLAKAMPGAGLTSVHRFFAGQSGITNMLHEIGTGNGTVTMDHMKFWMENGWSKFREEFPQAAEQLRHRGRGFASMYYSASERAGGITTHFSSGSKLARTGLVGYYGHRATLQANNEANNFARDAIKRVLGTDENRDIVPDLERQWGISVNSAKNTIDEETSHAIVRYLDYFPEGIDTESDEVIEEWFRGLHPEWTELEAKAQQGLSAKEERHFTRLAARLEDMKAVASDLRSQGDVALLEKFRPVWDAMRGEAAKHNIPLGDARMNFAEALGIPFEQADEWRRGAGLNHPITADLDDSEQARIFYIRASEMDAGRLQDLRNSGITSRALTHTDDGYGIRLHSVKQSDEDIAVVVRGNDFAQLDPHTGNMALPREGKPQWTLADEMAAAREVRDKALADATPPETTATPQSTPEDLVRATRADGYNERIIPPEELYRQEAELRTAALRAYRPGIAGVYRQADEEGGDVLLTAFEHTNVMAVGDDFAAVTPARGFVHRTLSERASKWLQGNLKTETEQIMLSVPQLRAKLARETLDMTFSESNEYVRQKLIAIIREAHPTNTELADRIIRELPEVVWETNLAKVHALYLNDLAQAIRSRYLADAGQRQWSAVNLAPAMLGAPPRHLEHDWMLPPGVLQGLVKKDKKLVKQVLQAHKKAAQYMNRQHKYFAAVAQDFGTFSMLVDDALAEQAIARASREGDAWIRYGLRRSEARKAMDQADNTLSESIARLEEEEQFILTQRIRVLDAQGEEFASRFDAELEAGNVYYNRNTDSVLHKDGQEFVKRGGGRRLRPLHDIELEWTELSQQLERVRQLRDSFETLGFLPETVIRGETPNWGSGTLPPSLPKKMFHGTGRAFEMFDEKHFDPTALFGPGIYMTDVKEVAESYAVGAASRVSNVEQFEVTVPAFAEFGGNMEGLRTDPFTHAQAKRLAITQASEKTAEELGEERALDAVLYATGVRLNDEGTEYTVTITRGLPPEPGTVEPTIKEGFLDIRNPYKADRLIDDDVADLIERELKKRFKPEDVDEHFNWVPEEDAMFHVKGFRGRNATEVYQDVGAFLSGMAGKQGVGANSFANKFLGEIGFDGITYNGGARVGGLGSHRVAVAFKPEQFIDAKSAPAKMAEKAEFALKARRVAQQAHGKSQKQAAEAAVLMERARVQMDAAMAEVNKTMAEAKQLGARLKPALQQAKTIGDLNGLTVMRIPGLEGYAMPDYIAEEWHRIYDAKGPDFLRQEWRKWVIGPWKRWATYRWPGFHVRNFYGAWFNNWLGGVEMRHYGLAHRLMSKPDEYVRPQEFDNLGLKYLFGEEGRDTLTYGELRAHLSHIGVGGANVRVVSEAGNTTDMVKEVWDEVSKQRGQFKRAARKLDGKLRGVGETTENFFRFAAWAQGMEVTDGDTWGARAFTMMRHGDYTDLTPAEDFIRDLVPFYKWMRTNLPYQVRMLMENPGKVVAVADKVKNLAYDVAGYDRQQAEAQMPQFLKEDLALPIPDWVPVFGSKGPDAIQHAVLNMPYSDLYNGLHDYIASALPYVRNVVESWGFERNAFTGRPLEGRMVKLSGMWNLPGIRDVLAASSVAHKGPDGNIYITDKVENVLSGWPIWSRFRNFAEADPARVEARMSGVLSALAGVSIRPSDFTQAELDFFYNEVEPLLQMYRDMGVTFPTAQEFVDSSAFLYGGQPVALPESVQTNGVFAEGVTT